MDENEIREIAKKQLKKQADFKGYLWIWLAVSVMLTAIWALTSFGTYYWPIWAIFGMGIGALFSGIDAYGKNPRIISEAAIDAEVHRLKGTKPESS
ncbi:hypothetical protein GCM10027022_12470 [Alpinimonas psychrophila]|uniref:Fatty acid desaturase n=1 Tax=Alpinimonas psychrophila TaxID=748908 RepID=A0A7W3JTT5_9MICO|nr:2TM domain-containing protein [Alpinimonas psychrophila]MBA8829073.1 fatty acid desaturase [Alpinimonas psychrophila]